MGKFSRREFGVAAGSTLLLQQFLLGAKPTFAADRDTGPLIGHVSDTTAHLWFRPTQPGNYTIAVTKDEGEERLTTTTSTAANDFCITWELSELNPSTRYRYQIFNEYNELITDDIDEHHFTTAPAPSQPNRVCLAFGSCAHSKPLKLWKQMSEQGVQGLVLLGDTPYIDSTDLGVLRQKHRAFLQVPELANLVRKTPTWATWDDHDFGKNDSDGTLPGKEYSRQAFVEYRANANYGHEHEGIYTRFRYGPVEVFVLDTRWFARTEPSPIDPDKPTLLGARQWAWLQQSLLASTAPFKIITCGMIWDDKQNTESDDWGTYTHERTALFEFLGANNISGVVLIGGDIHCSRLLKYKTEDQVGYAIRQCIVSPIHDSTIPSLNVAHPDLVRGEAIPHVWLRVEVDSTASPTTFEAKWQQMDGQDMWSMNLDEADLSKS